MASVWKHPQSRYWVACFTDADGVQRKRSTRTTDRTRALAMAQKFEGAYRSKLTEAQARKVISDIFADIHGEELLHRSCEDFLRGWLNSKKAEMTSTSFKRYESAVSKFVEHLAARAARDIAYVSKRDVQEFRDAVAARLSASTANTDLKILRTAFKQAMADGLRLDNPAAPVAILGERRGEDAGERRPFTEAEIKQLLKAAEGEWKGMILFGLYTGQRLGDIAALTARRVNLQEGVLQFKTHKTGRDMVIPIADTLSAYLKSHLPGNPDDPVFPKAYALRKDAQGESRKLSAAFTDLLHSAELGEKRKKKETGEGRSVRRRVSELSFHSLRHTATSMLKRAGVPESVVRDIIGHESELVSRNYTHIDDATKRKAIRSLPDFAGNGRPSAKDRNEGEV